MGRGTTGSASLRRPNRASKDTFKFNAAGGREKFASQSQYSTRQQRSSVANCIGGGCNVISHRPTRCEQEECSSTTNLGRESEISGVASIFHFKRLRAEQSHLSRRKDGNSGVLLNGNSINQMGISQSGIDIHISLRWRTSRKSGGGGQLVQEYDGSGVYRFMRLRFQLAISSGPLRDNVTVVPFCDGGVFPVYYPIAARGITGTSAPSKHKQIHTIPAFVSTYNAMVSRLPRFVRVRTCANPGACAGRSRLQCEALRAPSAGGLRADKLSAQIALAHPRDGRCSSTPAPHPSHRGPHQTSHREMLFNFNPMQVFSSDKDRRPGRLSFPPLFPPPQTVFFPTCARYSPFHASTTRWRGLRFSGAHHTPQRLIEGAPSAMLVCPGVSREALVKPLVGSGGLWRNRRHPGAWRLQEPPQGPRYLSPRDWLAPRYF
ncbi:hypothetical protein FB451DRAFT_1448610 [Mycena latifolia]|nr:hypothetical protein FB451DRAFT_1448610 [Mycena latifolia]